MTIKTSKMSIGNKRPLLTIFNGKKESKREKLMTNKDKLRKQNTRKETKKGIKKRNLKHIWDKLNLLTS